MSRMVRFMMPVDPNNIQAAAQAMFDAVQGQLAQSAQPKNRRMGGERDWTPDELKKLESGEAPGGFAGPNKSYPIGSAQDVSTCWNLADLSPDAGMVRLNIKSIARKFGWQHALPAEAWE